MTRLPEGFAGRIVRWQQSHGRHALPWQGTRDAYRVWLSEIMLQQTQVATVLAYYERFLQRFPDVRALAAAPVDDVLGLWSGLGYYSRARNLHRCAQDVVALHGGDFPRDARTLATLPGIGRSTAAAIASFCFGERAAILDGNVKRVLTRVFAYGEDLAQAGAERALWSMAEDLLPTRDLATSMPRYTQGLMDLGATVCLPKSPSCLICPVREVCAAHGEGRPETFPVKTRKLKRTAQSLWLLHAQRRDGAVWLAKRPDTGVWAGLYCLPMFDTREALDDALPARIERCDEPAFKHVLTHKDLHLHPVRAMWSGHSQPHVPGKWIAVNEWPSLGLPTPIRKLLSAHAT